MKTFFRFLLHNRLYSIINMAGLSVSLALAMIIFGYAWKQYSISVSFPDGKNIYAVGKDNELSMCYGAADLLRNSLPEAISVTRFIPANDGVLAEYNGHSSNVFMMLADSAFFEMSGIRILEGDISSIYGKSSCVLVSQSFADKVSEGTDITGSTIMIGKKPFRVAGIVEDFGEGLIPYADIICGVESGYFIWQYIQQPFNMFGPVMTLVKTEPGTDRYLLEEKTDRILKEHIAGDSWKTTLIRADELYFHHDNWCLNSGNLKVIRNMVLVGIALLISALCNYINLSTAVLGKRAKEMATRRLLGSSRNKIILKYISESGVFTSVCFSFALILAVLMSPVADRLVTASESASPTAGISIGDLFQPEYILCYMAMTALISVIAGIVPAMTSSQASPVDIVKGRLRLADKKVLSKAFIMIQSAIAVTLMTLALTMEEQTRYMMERPSGCSLDDIYCIMADFPEGSREVFLEKLRTLPCVEKAGACDAVPGCIGTGFTDGSNGGKEQLYFLMRCDSITFNMLGFNIIHQFSPSIPKSLWMSESAMKAAGLSMENHDIPENIAYSTDANIVCGVVSDFIVTNAGYPEKLENPMISIQSPDSFSWDSYAIKTAGSHAEARKMLTEAYEKQCIETFGTVFPAWMNGYVTDQLAAALEGNRKSMRLIEIFMVIAVIISMSGLVAMSIYYTDANRKSIALHKIYGGSVTSEMVRNMRTYLAITLAADIIALPPAVFLCRKYLENFAYRIELEAWIFIVTLMLSIIATVLSVSWQILKASRLNPSDSLRTE